MHVPEEASPSTERHRWRRVEDLFHQLADLPPGDDRDAALQASCGHDAALAAEVRALLENDTALVRATPAADPHVGLRLGHYAVGRLIARGGMAAVYEAHRADDAFDQRVAVKIMDVRLSDQALVAQFRAERQILAALEHPSLTRLLDGGVTPLGEPYLVMEFVEGEPIDRYADGRRLDLRARVALFIEVCDGVSFAHRNLVLHRDLKPSNILVTSDGRAKVVDFGTATLLQPDRLATTSRAPLTPAYASPEQLTGAAVGTASDQYSLGLVLFELLTGACAFGERSSLMAAMERALAGTTSPAPQTMVTDAGARARQSSPSRLRRTLSGDLGTIVGKALAHDPAARYASVQHLVDDLARWRAGEPIQGRPPSVVYQMSRFVRRHWVSTAVATTLALALVAATAVSIDQAARAGSQARIAEAESGKARQLNRFLTRMLSSANPSWYNADAASAGSITVRQVLDGAGDLIARELGATPAVEAEMRRTLGRTYIGLGDVDRARPHLTRALELYRGLGDAFGTAFTEALLGESRLATGEFASAEAHLRPVLAYVRSLGDTPTDPELHMMATNDLAVAISSQRPGDAEAIALKREAIMVGDRTGAGAGGAAVSLTNLSIDLMSAGQLDEAEAALRDALRRMDALPTPPPERYGVLNNLSTVLRVRGDITAAAHAGRVATDGAAQVWGRTHYRWAAFATTWARALVATDDPGRAREPLRAALEVFRLVRPAGHADLIGPLIGLGVLHRRMQDLRASERDLRQAYTIAAANPALKDRAADAAGELGLTLRALGDAAAASALLAESHGTWRRLYGDAHPSTRLAQSRLRGSGQ